ncbi:hypothetical protein TNCV_2850131 [Trichonephila clavipes]|nr:hypothetical protein TNCV_2850131 [Trichonephila clavipes]
MLRKRNRVVQKPGSSVPEAEVTMETRALPLAESPFRLTQTHYCLRRFSVLPEPQKIKLFSKSSASDTFD